MAFPEENQTPNPPGVTTLVLQTLGWCLARAPESVPRAAAALGGEALLWLAPRRRRLMESNLAHAFPDRTVAWRRGIARASSHRLVETALLALAAPSFSERRIRACARLAPSVDALARDLAARPRPVVLATLHLALWETQTWLLRLSPVPLPEFGIIFRPLDNPAADAFFQRARERFGMRLLSRKAGFAEALRILRERGVVGVLFDQNAGNQGALTLLFGRVGSSTELPGLLAAKFGAELRTFYPRRTGFWRVEFESDPIAHDGSVEGATVALNRWLETALADSDLCASWLWAHDRWRNQDVPARRLRLEAKRDFLAADLAARGLAALPRRTRIWIRLPNWLGDVVMALPLLRALRVSRPDAELTLLAQPALLPLLETWGVADRLQALPPRGPGYFLHFLRLRGAYPDVWILFTQSVRGDLEARLTGCPQRFGILRPGRRRPLLTHAYSVPPEFDESRHHQFELWTKFLEHFGLQVAPDPSPIGQISAEALRSASAPPPPVPPSPRTSAPAVSTARPPARPAAVGGPIGLIAGSENNPAKRWPIAHWRALIEALPHERFVLFGTAGDAPITSAIAVGFDPARVENLAGRTSLPAYAARLRACRLIVANDTGGMHLANALGVPLIALFGPTNPVRTGPIFSAQVQILQPAGCPAAGGGSLSDLTPEAVIKAVRTGLPFRIDPTHAAVT
jgi:ADP-heptose:LPS heptosyltransferase/lauroyl/myristoyl acyltransferase